MSDKKNGEFLMYRGRPLVRKGDEIYYGKMNDRFVIKLQVVSKSTVNSEEIADQVNVLLIDTEEIMNPRRSIVKRSEKKGLYQAMDIGAVWLDRALSDYEKHNA